MRYSYIQFLLFSFVLTLLQCNEEPKPSQEPSSPLPAVSTVSTKPVESIDLGDTKVATGDDPAIKSQMVDDGAWGDLVDEYAQGGIARNITNVVQTERLIRNLYKDLEITAYLQDLIAFNNYFKYKAYLHVPKKEEEGRIIPNMAADRFTDEELAYPLVRSSYLSNFQNILPQPAFLPLVTEGIAPEDNFDATIKYYEELLSLYELIFVAPNKKDFFFETDVNQIGKLRYDWAKTLNTSFEQALAEEAEKIENNRVTSPGQPQVAYANTWSRLNLNDAEKQQLIVAMKARPLKAATLSQIGNYATELGVKIALLEEKLELIRNEVKKLSAILDPNQVIFFQQVYVEVQTFVANQKAMQNALTEFANTAPEKTSQTYLVTLMEVLKTHSWVPAGKLRQTYEPIKNTYYQKVRSLESEFKRRQAEQ